MKFSFTTRTVSIHELRKRFGEIERTLPFVRHITITKNGRPIARISSLIPKKDRKSGIEGLKEFAGLWKGKDLDDDKLWENILERQSRSKSIKL